MADERQMSVAEWQTYFDDLRERAKDPAAALSTGFRGSEHWSDAAPPAPSPSHFGQAPQSAWAWYE
jgi:hypothetical protein